MTQSLTRQPVLIAVFVIGSIAAGNFGQTIAATPSPTPALPYLIVDTGQAKCYDDRKEIAPPKPGQPFYGQDAQFRAHPSSYTLSPDGLTVHDNTTGLTWQRSPHTDGNGAVTSRDKLTIAQARALPAKLNAAKFAGFDDWRLPSIKELYSLFDARGIDQGPPSAQDIVPTPFIDTRFFEFAYGDTQAGERAIDSQWASSTCYVANPNQMFGVNFADGRIKGYGTSMPGRTDKTFFVLCVCGNPKYGQNDFHDNADGTIADRATGLMWSKADSGRGMNWRDALAWAQQRNAEKYLGHDDWRLPSAKELQSLVDYTRSPNTTKSAAIAPCFDCTAITNEGGRADYPFYWTATTHADVAGGGTAIYVAFGRASGWMTDRPPGGGPPDPRGGPPPGGPSDPRGGPGPEGFGPGGPMPGGWGRPTGPGPNGGPPQGGGGYRYVDVHGAGAQRSDPKAGDPTQFPHGRGPQGDVIRVFNYVRLVRSGPSQAP